MEISKQLIRRSKSEGVNPIMTENTMAKNTKIQTMANTILHRKLKIEQQEPN